MANRRNYQREMDTIIEDMTRQNVRKKLLLHSCCAPCSSYCLEYLSEYFDITLLYYNPNITEVNEYDMRIAEQERLIKALNEKYKLNIKFMAGKYEPDKFLQGVAGYEDCPEGGERCRICFALRLDEAARIAADNAFDYYTTTLTISPLKNADILNEIGESIGRKYNINFLPSDFKKKNGYKRSTELSKEYSLYRQNYCGCEYSKREAENRLDNDTI